MKKIIVMSILFIAAISLVACSQDEVEELDLNNLPALRVVYEDEDLVAVRGTFSWTVDNEDGTMATTDSDSEPPPELVRDTDPLEIAPNSTIELDFSHEPQDVTVNIWEDDRPLEQDISNMEIIVPDLEGLVIYEVTASWEQGTIHYAFLVDVN